MSTLIIVESGTKCGKIKSYLNDKYILMASNGHIIDLDSKKLSIDIENNFEPIYVTKEGQTSTITKLKNEVKKCTEILLAADGDREGEMIAWSLAHVLKLKEPKRIVFGNITKKEILEKIKNPKEIDYNMVDAQKTRRLIDRIVGFKLTELLWKVMGQGKSVSAGRVQSVALKLIVEKENEIKTFFEADNSAFFKFVGIFTHNKNELKSILYSKKIDKDENSESESESDSESELDNKTIKGIVKITSINKAKKIMNLFVGSLYSIDNIEEKDSIRYPSEPFKTSSLQQESSNKFAFNPKKTMSIAQKLYEAGYITYMRTDSITLAEDAMKQAKDYIINEYGNEFYKRTDYKSKSEDAQEAHEAIRPTDLTVKGININDANKISNDEIRLYNLIWKRTISSQMKGALFKIQNIKIKISKTNEYYFLASKEEKIFDGFLKVYDIKNLDYPEEIRLACELENKTKDFKGKILEVKIIEGLQEYKNPPKRYNDASLVSKLEKLKIGRPATYASYSDKIESKKFANKENISGIEKDRIIMFWDGSNPEETNSTCEKIKEKKDKIIIGKENKKFIPTAIGIEISKFLEKYFSNIIDYDFTSKLEKNLDKIAEGKIKWDNIMKEFYKTFEKSVKNIDIVMTNNVNNKSIDINARILSEEPEIIATIAKYGNIVKMLQNDNKTGISKYVYAPIKLPLTKDNITLEQALELLSYPKILGKYENKTVTLNKGQYGYWLKIGLTKESKTYSIGDENKLKLTRGTIEICDININDVDEIIEFSCNKKKSTPNNNLFETSDDKHNYLIKNGEFGMFLILKKKNKIKKDSKDKIIKIPNDLKLEDITIDKIKDIIKNARSNLKKYKK
jgi:DNA topoisomerase-1